MQRQPLASGAATILRQARLAAALPGAVAVAFAIQCWREGAPITAAVGALVGVAALVGAVAALLAPGEPPSDVHLDGEGLRVVGGRHHGLALGWSALDPPGASVEAATTPPGGSTARELAEALDPDGAGQAVELRLRLREGRTLTLARAITADEADSLRALAEALREHLVPPPLVDDAPPTAVRCPSCTAPARPSEAAAEPCAFCGAPVAMPEELRQGLAAHRALAATRRGLEATVTRLAGLPSARFAGQVALASFAAVTLLTLIGMAVLVALILADATDAFALGALAVSSGALVALAWQLSARAVVDRQALGAVGAHFGARPPRRPGEGWGCRSCGAPLPAGEGPILGCAYCGAESVPGFDARVALAPLRRRQGALSEELARHEVRRAGAQRGAMIAAAVGGLGGALLVVMGAFGVEALTDRRRCDAGDGAACYRVALAYFNGTTRADRPLALDRAERSCALGHLEGCCFVEDFVQYEWGTPRDLAAARRRLEEAAQRTGAPACAE